VRRFFSRQDLLRREQTENLADLANEIAGAGSLYQWLERHLSTSIDSAMAHIESVNAAAEQATALDLPPAPRYCVCARLTSP
jgi:DNA-binding GntR family transcriptional regulator